MIDYEIYPKRYTDLFWSHVDKKGDNECWLWTGTKVNGYGCLALPMYANTRRRHPLDRETIYAHRLSWEISNGVLDDGLAVRHSCVNKTCVNPNHLYTMSWADLARENKSKSNFSFLRGLSDRERLDIRADFMEWNGTPKDFGLLYGATESQILSVVKGLGSVKRRTKELAKSLQIAQEYDKCEMSMREMADRLECDIVVIHRAVKRHLSEKRREEIKTYHLLRKTRCRPV